MIISLIVAASENDVIGKDKKLPWSLPDDMKHFRVLTQGHPVIMGRKTYESIGHALPNRRNIVITRQADFQLPDAEVAPSVDAALKLVGDDSSAEAFVIGGGEIYKQMIEEADRIYMTRVHTTIDGDAFFPTIDSSVWKELSKEEHPKDEKHLFPFSFITYQKI
jgi:dihydrofolate reductase